MSVAKSVDVTILGREFTVSCTDEERQGLMDAVSYLDTKMHEIRDSVIMAMRSTPTTLPESRISCILVSR